MLLGGNYFLPFRIVYLLRRDLVHRLRKLVVSLSEIKAILGFIQKSYSRFFQNDFFNLHFYHTGENSCRELATRTPCAPKVSGASSLYGSFKRSKYGIKLPTMISGPTKPPMRIVFEAAAWPSSARTRRSSSQGFQTHHIGLVCRDNSLPVVDSFSEYPSLSPKYSGRQWGSISDLHHP